MGLSNCMLVEGLKVYGASWLAILLHLDSHPAAPRGWGIGGHLLKYFKSNIKPQLCFHPFLKVYWHLSSLVASYWLSFRVNKEFQGRTIFH